MARLKYQGKEIELAEVYRGRDLIAAENALKLDFFTGSSTAKMLITYYITIRKVDKDTPDGVLADAVLTMDLVASMVDGDEEEETAEGRPVPLGNGDPSLEIAARLTSGSQPSDISST